VSNLYLERLKRMSEEELVREVERTGKIMETQSPLTKDQKIRALMCFGFMIKHPGVSEENKHYLASAIRVLKLL
jgi:hypothetical protein